MKQFDVVIVGAGHGGAQAAIMLRQLGFVGSIAVIGDEPELPYERPPLSKEYLSGDKVFERLLIRPEKFWRERDVTFLLGRAVTAIDADAHRVMLGDEAIGYASLIWAAGGAPRLLPCGGHDLTGVHTVRSRADVDLMLGELAAVERVVVVGGGYIGLEAAAVLTGLGKHVTLLEALDRVLARVAGEYLSRFYEAEHRAHGVDLRLGAMVSSIDEKDGRVSGVRLSDDSVLAAQMVVVGIGIIPAVAPLIAAGAAGENGVAVDRRCRTSLPDIYAIGDCAAHANRFAGGATLRIESVQNASDQATVAAKAIMGGADHYDAIPWFWSNQYDLKLQTAGLSLGHDETLLRGDPAKRSFSVVYLRDGQVIALDCVNAVRDYVAARKLIEAEARPDRAQLADPEVPLKSLLTG